MSELIDLSQLPAPDAVETLDFETLFADRKKRFISLYPKEQQTEVARTLEYESEPAVKILQENAYLELNLRQRINEAAVANMLAYSTGADLDNLGANFKVKRKLISPGDSAAVPPIEAEYESDIELRRRIQLAFDGLNTAGSLDAYIFYALSAHASIRDASAWSPAPCEMIVTILCREGNGTAPPDVLDSVYHYFGVTADGQNATTPSKVRPQGDKLTVQAARIVHWRIQATIFTLPGPDPELVLQQARQAVQVYAVAQHKLGRDITLSGIYAALHQPGTQRVLLESPSSDLVMSEEQAGWCDEIILTPGGSDV
ncbi:baseplate assembly protein [Escherichia coli]|nr:baseplate assembly protein [Escherichia coli]